MVEKQCKLQGGPEEQRTWQRIRSRKSPRKHWKLKENSSLGIDLKGEHYKFHSSSAVIAWNLKIKDEAVVKNLH